MLLEIFWSENDRDIYIWDFKEFCDNILPTALQPYYVTPQRIWTKSDRDDVDF